MIEVQQIYATKTLKYVYKNTKVHMKTRTFTGNKTVNAIAVSHSHFDSLKKQFPRH